MDGQTADLLLIAFANHAPPASFSSLLIIGYFVPPRILCILITVLTLKPTYGSNDTFGYRVFADHGNAGLSQTLESDTMLVRGVQIMGCLVCTGVFDAGIGLSIGTTAAKMFAVSWLPSGEDWELVDRQADGYKWRVPGMARESRVNVYGSLTEHSEICDQHSGFSDDPGPAGH